MIIKSFVADSVAGALKMVRSELGGDAVILKTRKLDPTQRAIADGNVEVTACIDQTPVVNPAEASRELSKESTAHRIKPAIQQPNNIVPASAIVQKLDFLIDILQMPIRKNAFPGNIGRLFTTMINADVPEAMAYDLTDKLSDRFGGEDEYGLISSATCDLFMDQMVERRGPCELKTGQKIVLVGPAGAGKTSLMGRLAGYLIAEKKLPVCLSSLDQVKVSAPEELQSYAEILDVEHFEIPRQDDLSLLENQSLSKITLIDTPALNAKDVDVIRIYADKINSIKPDRVIGVFPATFRTSELVDLIRAYKPLMLTGLAITMVDQTYRLGGVVAMSILSGYPIEILGTGHKAGSIDLSPDLQKLVHSFLAVEEGKGYE
jgi:flagellar biosynthesis protein FlhF